MELAIWATVELACGFVSATNTAVGATAPGAGNVISGNNQHGVLISGSPATLHGNLIGTNAAGDAGVPNGLDGIRIEFASGNTIGGVPGFGNTIAFNTGSGLTDSNWDQQPNLW